MNEPIGIRLRHLHTLVAVAEERHLGRAAVRLRLTQPAISKTLAELERLLGRQLVDRGRHGARLTPDGDVFLPNARAVLDALAHASTSLSPAPLRADAVVKVGALPTVAPGLLPPTIRRFRSSYGAARLVLRTNTNALLLDDLRAGLLDLVVGRMSDPSLTSGLSFELLFLEPLVAVSRATHPLAAERRLALSRVLEFPLIICTPGSAPRQHTDTLFRTQGLATPSDAVETLDVPVARALVVSSDAIWIVPAGAVLAEGDRTDLTVLAIDTTPTSEPVGVFMRVDHEPSPATRALLAALRETAALRTSGRLPMAR